MAKFKEKEKDQHRINESIRAINVRIIGSDSAEDNGVKKLSEALQRAGELEVDLVEINPNQDPPICRLIEYSKFKYELKKQAQLQKKKNKSSELKEVRLGPNMGLHDYEFKLRQIKDFLKDGDKVRAVITFKGREIMHKANGEKTLLKMATEIEDCGVPDAMPKLEGKKLFISFSPKK